MVDRRPHGGNAPDDVLDFSASLNPLGPPEAVRRVLQERPELTQYPYGLRDSLRKLIADEHGIKADNVLIGAGTSGLLQLLLQALPGDRLVVPTPTFTEYEDLGTAFGWTVDPVSLHPPRDGTPDGVPVGDAELVMVCNPNNPGGSLLARETMEEFRRVAERNDTYLVVDEAYMPFVDAPDEETLVPEIREGERLVVLRSFSKFYGIPGLRVGYLLAPGEIVERMRARQNPWPVGEPALRGARQCLRAEAFQAKSREFIQDERGRVYEALRDIPGLSVLPSRTNFLLFESTVDRLNEGLRERSLAVRDASTFTGLESGWYRIGLRTASENDRLLTAIQALHGEPSRV